MLASLANPHRFMGFSRWAAPLCAALAVLLIVPGLWLGFAAPEDYQQGTTVRIMFIHVPAAWMSMFTYACLGGASFFSLVFRHALADAAARQGPRGPAWAPPSPSSPLSPVRCGDARSGEPGGCGTRD